VLVAIAVILQALPAGAAVPSTVTISPGEAEAKTALEKSPRHHEWVSIAVPGVNTKVSAFVAYPERKD